MQRQVRIHVYLSIICALALGCSSEAAENSPGDAGPQEDASPESAAESGGEDVAPDAIDSVDLEIVTLEMPGIGASTSGDTPWDKLAVTLEGAVVAVDLSDGTRREVTTDAGGKASISVAGTADDIVVVTAYKSDYAIASWKGPMGMAKIPLGMFRQTPLPSAASVVLSGTASGMTDTSHQLTVHSTASGFSQEIGENFVFDTFSGRPFSLVGLEWWGCTPSCSRCICQTFFGWTRVDHEAVTEDTTVKLDFSQSLDPVTTTGTVELPTRVGSPIRAGELYMMVSSFDANLTHGYSLTTDLSEDESSFTYTAEHVVWDGASDVNTMYQLTHPEAVSLLTVDGYPAQDAQISGFLDAPEMISPTGTAEPVSVVDTFEWVPTSGETTEARLYLVGDNRVVWSAVVASGSSIQLPKLPSTADPAEVLGDEPLAGFIQLLSDTDKTNAYYEKACTSMNAYTVLP